MAEGEDALAALSEDDARLAASLAEELRRRSATAERDDMSDCIRQLRRCSNRCAREGAFAHALAEVGAFDSAAGLLASTLGCAGQETPASGSGAGAPAAAHVRDLAAACAVLMSNAALSSPRAASAAWSAVAERSGALAAVLAHDDPSVVAPASMMLHSCCLKGESCSQRLARSPSLLQSLLTHTAPHMLASDGDTSPSHEAWSDALQWQAVLISRVAMADGHLEDLAASLWPQHRAQVLGTTSEAPPTAIAAVATALAAEAERILAPESSSEGPPWPPASSVPAALVHLLQAAAAAPPSSRTTAATLRALLGVFRAAAATEPTYRGRDPVLELHDAGATDALVLLLQALGPVDGPRKKATAEDRAAWRAALPPERAAAVSRCPATAPYTDFRADVLAALSNASHRRPQVAETVLRVGGVEVILSCCQVDERSPMAREWALWGVRNLCEASDGVKARIAALRPTAPVQTEDLDRMGMEVEVDRATGQLRVSRKAPAGGDVVAREGDEGGRAQDDRLKQLEDDFMS